VGNTPAPAINNPVHLTLTGGATWVPTATSYLEELTLEPGSTIQGTILVDGAAVTQPGHYCGSIQVTP
jgi:hypothetical protein